MSSPAVPLRTLLSPAFLFDADAVVTAANPAAERLAGGPLAGLPVEGLLRRFAVRSLRGEPLPIEDLPVTWALAGEEVPDRQIEVTGADGERWVMRVSAAPIREDGRVTGAVSIWHDVTTACRTGEALRESEAIARSFMENMVDGCAICETVRDEHGEPVDIRLVEINPALARRLPKPLGRLEGRTAYDLIPSLDRSWFDLFLEVCRTGTPMKVEEPFLAFGRSYHVAGFPVRGGRIAVVFHDITELREAEAALLESEERFRTLASAAFEGIVVSENGVIQAANDQYAKMHGYEPSEIIGLPILEVIAPVDHERVLAALESGSEQTGEYHHRRQDGSVFVVEARGRPMRWNGRCMRVTAVHDITERKRAEVSLRESATRILERDLRLNLALDIAAVGTFDWNPATGEETWDDRLRALWGIQPGGPVDHEVFEAGIHPADRAAVEAANRRAFDPAGDGRYGAEYRVVGLSDGVERRVSAWGQAFFEHGRPVRMVGTVIDITEQRRAEAAARAGERILQSIFRAAPAGIGLVSSLARGRRLTQANDRFLEMTGYARDELIGADTRVLYLDDESYEAVGRDSALQLGASGRGEVETRWRRKDGSVFDLLISSSLIDPSDPDEGVIFIALDLSNLRESQRSLQRYARDLARSNEELQRFAYVASHDLQEPLRSIISFSQLLERRYGGRLDSDADEFIGFIVDGGNRMQRLIEDLLQLSRVETRARPPVPTDANGPAGDALRSLESAVRDAGATVTIEPLPEVTVDPAQLAQVFLNLVSNAVKYRNPDRALEIRIEARRLDGEIEFSVADNGIGIEAEYHDRIFEMFRRLHTHDQYEGTGIGLALVKKIVDRHGGRCWVESAPGEGSTFFFTLPAA